MSDEQSLAAAIGTSMEFNAALIDCKWLVRWHQGHRTHHLHIVVAGSTPWSDRLAFRDALPSAPVTARRYAQLRSEFAAKQHGDREASTDAKSAFARTVLLAHRQCRQRRDG